MRYFHFPYVFHDEGREGFACYDGEVLRLSIFLESHHHHHPYLMQSIHILLSALYPHQILYVEESLILKYINDGWDVLLIRPNKHKTSRNKLAVKCKSFEVVTIIVWRSVNENHLYINNSFIHHLH